MTIHLVWDWNGTLLRDTHVVLEATNEALAALRSDGGRVVDPLTPARYRAAFARPLRRFYATIFGRDVTDEEFLRLEQQFHAAYLRRIAACGLNRGATQILAQWQGSGRTQSLLSLWTHAELLARVAGLGLTEYFVRVDGRRAGGVDGLDGKTQPLLRHLDQLRRSGAMSAATPNAGAESLPNVVLIGDSLDDLVAARAAGVGCVLFVSGIHEVAALEATGVPVARTLAQAVDAAESLTANP